MKRRKDGLMQTQITVIENGKKKQKYFYGHSSSEINKKIAAYQGEAAKGPHFTDIADEWQEKHFSTLANGTRMCYSPAVKRAKEAFEGLRVSEVTSADISRVIMRLKDTGASAKTVKTQKTVINMIFNYAIIEGYITTNPTAPVRIPANLPKKRRELPADAILKTVKASVGLEFGLFAYLLLYTGCRRGEALALQYGDIDRASRLVHVTKAVFFENNKAKLKSTKTEAGRRDIILLDQLAEQIPQGPSGSYLFGGDRLLTEREFRDRWKKYCIATGLAEIITEQVKNEKTNRMNTVHRVEYLVTPHQLRHAYATILYEAGIDEFTAKTLLGHTDIKLTRDIYTHIRQSKQDAAGEKLKNYLSENPI